MTTLPKLMIIDDDQRFRERLTLSFSKRGYDTIAFEDGTSALNYFSEKPVKYVIVDLKLAGEWGLNIVETLLQLDPNLSIIVLTAYGSIATAIEAVRLGAINYLQKPVSVDEIEKSLINSERQVTKTKFEDADIPSLARVEWEHINRVLTDCDGNIRQSAQKLGMHRRTLQRKLAKYPVSK